MGIGNNPFRWGAVQHQATSASSATFTAVGSETYAIRLIATAACHVHISQPTIAATVSDSYIAGFAVPEYVCVSPGDVVTVIQHSGAGVLYLTELTY